MYSFVWEYHVSKWVCVCNFHYFFRILVPYLGCHSFGDINMKIVFLYHANAKLFAQAKLNIKFYAQHIDFERIAHTNTQSTPNCVVSCMHRMIGKTGWKMKDIGNGIEDCSIVFLFHLFLLAEFSLTNSISLLTFELGTRNQNKRAHQPKMVEKWWWRSEAEEKKKKKRPRKQNKDQWLSWQLL